jgi:hypothetical protein
MRTTPLILAALLATAVPYASSAQTTTGSAACSSLYQTAANAVSARIAADDQNIAPPQTIKSLTCLDNFFKGVGLNVITNLLDPTQLNKQCGITLTGFNLGTFNGLGGGLSCPKLSFGGGGPPIGYIGVGTNNSGRLSVTGTGRAPTGYNLPTTMGLW